MSGTDSEKSIRATVTILATIISSVASGLNILLIWDMKLWTSHSRLIFFMSVYQFIYDTSFYSALTNPSGSTQSTVALVINTFGGCTTAFFSNIIMFSVLYIVLYHRSFDATRYLNSLHLLAVIPAIIIESIIIFGAVVNSSSTVLHGFQSYTYIRLFSIALNIFSYIYMSYILYKLRSKRVNNQQSQLEESIKVLVDRLKWYPLIQALVRIGPTWYEYSVDLCQSFINPLGSVGFLIVFLMLQPRAYRHAVGRLQWIVKTLTVSSRADTQTSFAAPLSANLSSCDVFLDSTTESYAIDNVETNNNSVTGNGKTLRNQSILRLKDLEDEDLGIVIAAADAGIDILSAQTRSIRIASSDRKRSSNLPWKQSLWSLKSATGASPSNLQHSKSMIAIFSTNSLTSGRSGLSDLDQGRLNRQSCASTIENPILEGTSSARDDL